MAKEEKVQIDFQQVIGKYRQMLSDLQYQNVILQAEVEKLKSQADKQKGTK